MTRNKLIIFDFDGVLVNTRDLCFSLHQRNNPWITMEYFNRLANGNWHENVDRAKREDGFVVTEQWYEQYSEGLSELSTHDIIAALVRDLSQKYELTICSSMKTLYISQALAKDSIDGFFSEVLGGDTHRSKVVKIQNLLASRQMSSDDAVFITDTTGDIQEGREAGVQSIGVTWGQHDKKKLESECPYAIVDTVPELEAAIEKFFMIQ